jgi:gluconate kinase
VHFQRENDDKLGGLPSSRDSDRVPFLEGVKKRCGLEEMKKKTVLLTMSMLLSIQKCQVKETNEVYETCYTYMASFPVPRILCNLLKHEPNR